MLEDQVTVLLQKYLGIYVRGLSKEALKISVWKGDVELTNMQLRPEALNALKLPVKVKAGFLGSVKLKVPWSRLGQEPVLVSLDRIFILAEPAADVEGCNEDSIQEAKRIRIREMEMKLLEHQQQLKSEMNTSWLGSIAQLVDAEKRLLGNALQDVDNQHFVLLSDSCVPLHSFDYVFNYLMLTNISFIDCFEDPGPHGSFRYSKLMLPEVRKDEFRKGSQWFSVKRQHAVLILADNLYYTKFKLHCKPGTENVAARLEMQDERLEAHVEQMFDGLWDEAYRVVKRGMGCDGEEAIL